MKAALVTGATGYIGSVIAAELIHRGYRILAPVRGEPGRVEAKVAEALRGFGRAMPGDLGDRIREVTWEAAGLAAHPWLPEAEAAFHCAVEMSFSPLKLSEVFEFNLRGTLALYDLLADLLAERAPKAPRFFYISTAYTGGIGEAHYPETLHTAPRILNPYQASKWATEMALARRRESAPSLPVTVYRPTLVIGHSGTGWYGGKSFALYSYLDSVKAGKDAGGTELRFDVDPEVAHDYLCIDTLAEDIGILLEREGAPFSVAHGTGSRQTNAWRYGKVGEEYGVAIRFAPPETRADKLANRNQVFNEPFNRPGLAWDFEARHIASLLGRERRAPALDDATFRRLVRWYRDHRQ